MQPTSNLPGSRSNAIPMLRPLYKAECHIFEHQGNQILFDIATGTFFQIDSVALDMVEACNGTTLKELMDLLQDRHSEKQIFSAFKELLDAGILCDVPPEKNRLFAPPDRLEVVHLDLTITTDSLSEEPGQNYMSEAVATKAVDLLMKESGRIRQCRLRLLGGEPLLNAPLVEKVIARARHQADHLGKELVVELVTDGELLNEELFNRLQKQNVDIVLKLETSGPELGFKGLGAYSLSSKRLQEHIIAQNAPVHLTTLSRLGVDLRNKIQKGLAQYPTAERVMFSLATPQSQAELEGAQKALEDLTEYVTQHVLGGAHAWIGDFEDRIFQVVNQQALFYHGGAGVRSLSVTPDGTLYADPDETFVMGNVFDGIDREKQKTWIRSTHVETMTSCATCWARHLCGGACKINAQSENASGCALTKRAYELAMAACLTIASHDMACLHRRYAEQN